MTPEILVPSYSLPLVLASFLVSALGAYTALTAMTLHRGRGGVNRFNVFLAGLSLGGVGIWSMHFLGMTAWHVDMALGYRLPETLVSLAAAVAASTVALGYMAAGPFSLRRLAVAGPVTGLGVAGMHYLGMYSMRFGGYFDWNLATVALSVLIAMATATVALWLAFHVVSQRHRVAASLLMAAAVSTMHYTGMAAADVVCTTQNRMARLAGLLTPGDLPLMVIMVAVGIAIFITTDLLIQRAFRQPAALRTR